jgi:hypothetical protein
LRLHSGLEVVPAILRDADVTLIDLRRALGENV